MLKKLLQLSLGDRIRLIEKAITENDLEESIGLLNEQKKMQGYFKKQTLLKKYSILLSAILLFSIPSNAATYTVSSSANSGANTLRQAIFDANANASAGTDIIVFNFASATTITLTALLPEINDPVTINGYSATSAVQGPIGSRTIRITINGGNTTSLTGTGGRVSSNGLIRFGAGASGSSISGLSIINTGTDVKAIMIEPDVSNIHVWGNYIGVNAAGVAAAGTANRGDALFLGDADRTTAGSATNLFVGTNGDGTNDANEGNVLSNCSTSDGGDGLGVGSSGFRYTLTNLRFSGNYIGVAADGTTIASNGSTAGSSPGGTNGLYFQNLTGAGASQIIIGTDANGTSDALEANVISGNVGTGIGLNSCNNVHIAGNLVGTDKTGLLAKPNGVKTSLTYNALKIGTSGDMDNQPCYNIFVGFNDANHIASRAAIVRNVISGNANRGIGITGVPDGGLQHNNIVIAGNYIGADITGNTALSNGLDATATTFSGTNVHVLDATDITIGTNGNGVNDDLEGNVISAAKFGYGVYMAASSITMTNSKISGNKIGVGANGTTAMGNDYSGERIVGATNIIVGSNDNGTSDNIEPNIIANNASLSTETDGVKVTGTSTRIRISRNSFYNNRTLPIDLADDGITLNNGATTAGQPNLLLDYPVITDHSISGTTINVSGYVSTCGGTEKTEGASIAGLKTIQFYKVDDDGDQTGALTDGTCSRNVSHGEGMQYLGSITGVTNTFSSSFTLVSGASFSGFDKITAIAIDANGNTSEFGVDAVVPTSSATPSCTAPAVGCTSVDFTNSYINSTDPNTIEYDNIVSTFHSTVARQSDGTIKVWGERMANDGNTHVLTPQILNATNYPALTGSILKFTGGSDNGDASTLGAQYAVLTTTGLFVWGLENSLISDGLTTSNTFQKITVGGKTDGLPTGVSPADVKMIFGSHRMLALVTCSGDVYTLINALSATAATANAYGDGTAYSAANNIIWHRVKQKASTNLTNVVAVRGGGIYSFAALKSDGTLWTWGYKTCLGNGTAMSFTRNYATQMTLPTGVVPKMIGMKGCLNFDILNYHLLSSTGLVYSLGSNTYRQLGNISSVTTDRVSWVSALSAVGTPLDSIVWISPSEHDGEYMACVNAIQSDGSLWGWGSNNSSHIGTTSPYSTDPVKNRGGLGTSKILAVETGGHTTLVVKQCDMQFGYVGHRINGSMGDGTAVDAIESNFNFTSTAVLNLCGVSISPDIKVAPTTVCVNTPVTLKATPAGGTFHINSGSATLSGDVLTPTAAGPISIVYVLPSCDATASFTFDASNCPPIANNIAAAPMNNSLPSTAIPQLQASSPSSTVITSYSVLTLPLASEGVLYYCASAPAVCSTGTLTAVSTSTVLTPAQSESLYFDPAATFTGNVNFTYNATDANGLLSNTANYTIPVFNNPPTSQNITAAPVANTATATAIPALIAADGDGTIATYNLNSIPPSTSGILSYCATGSLPGCTPTTISGSVTGLTPAQVATLRFDPDPSFTGNYVYEYSAIDNNGNVSNTSTYTIPVVATASLGGNLPPVATNIISQNISNNAGATAIPNLLGTDPDGAVANYTINTFPTAAQGVLSYCSTGTLPTCTAIAITGTTTLTPAQALTLRFDPEPTFIGTAIFEYTATDNDGAPLTSAPATYQIPVVNTPPVANPDMVVPIANTVTTPTLLPPLSGSDYDGTVVTYNITTVPPSTSGTLQYCVTGSMLGCTLSTISGPITGLTPAQVATLNFTPNSGFTGNYVFNFTVVDNNGLVSQPAPFTIPVIATDVISGEPPLAYNYNATPVNSSTVANLSAALTGTDPDGTIASYTVTSITPANEGVLTYCVSGTLPGCTPTAVAVNTVMTPAQKATIQFTPNANFTGTATFNYTNLDNDDNLSNTATVTIPVVNNPPVAQNISNPAISKSSGATTLNPLVSTDADGTVVSYTILSIPSPGEGLLQVCDPAPAKACVNVTPGMNLTPAQIAQLAFTPNDTVHSPVVTFLYATTDNSGNGSNIAAVNIPINDAVILPIQLLQFTATKQGNKNALIEWLAGEEKAGVQYHLQHSTTGQIWTNIATQKANNNGLSENKYSYLHSNLANGKHLYRLLISDLADAKSYSPTRSVVIEGANNYQISLYPNPFVDKFTLNSSDASVISEVKIYTNEGRLIATFTQVNSGTEINMNNYSAGFYVLKIKDKNGELQVVKLIKK